MTMYSYEAPGNRSSGVRSVKWNGIALVGRQGLIILFSVILARILGPDSYGIVAQASVYLTFTTLLLDQGVSAALISRKRVDNELLGASVTLNLALAGALIGVTVLVAPAFAAFMRTPELESALPVLSLALVGKGGQVVPRMLLMRTFRFRALAWVEISAALIGGAIGTVWALVSPDFWALIAQLVASDVVLVVLLLVVADCPLPNLRLRRLREILGFSVRVFAGGLLNFGSRNMDTLLVGRYLGEAAAGQYSLAYRVLLMPIQMVGQTVSRVLFPIIARDRDSREKVSSLLLRCAGSIAAITFPAMAAIAIAAHDAVVVFLGPHWLPSVPVIAILAVTGARQSVTALNAPTMLGFGRSDIQLKFVIVAAITQISGIIVGVAFGIVGVAVGYTIAGIMMTPVVFLVQKHLAGTALRSQIAVVLPALHAALWAMIPYALLYLTGILPIVRLLIGVPAGAIIYFTVLWLCHRAALRGYVADGKMLMRSRRGGSS